jgi:hypothetical protein
MSNRTLFNISDDLLALDALLDEIDGDVTEGNTEDIIDGWLSALQGDLSDKLTSYGFLIRSLESDVKGIKDELDRLKARKSARENRVTALKERLEAFMKVQGKDRIETPVFTFALQKAGGKPKVTVADHYLEHPEELPEGFRRVKFEVDLVAVREQLEAGNEDVKEWASLEVSQPKLRIR